MESFGKTAAGQPVFEAYQPDLIDFSFEVSDAKASPKPMEEVIPLPAGWPFDRDRKQLLLEPNAADFCDFRAAFGFVASIGEAKSADTDSPFLLAIVAKLFPRYGFSHREASGSFAFARVNAFSSKAVLDRNFEAARLGTPVRGLLAPTDSTYASAQLNCWSSTTFTEWKTASPRSFFERGISIDHDAIYHLPLLGRRFLDISGSAFSKLIIHPGRLKIVVRDKAFQLPKPSGAKKPRPAKKEKGPNWDAEAQAAREERKLIRQGLVPPPKPESELSQTDASGSEYVHSPQQRT